MKVQNWRDLTTTDFAALDAEKTIAILPIAATEQHGPHLPLGTDSHIAECLLDTFKRQAQESDVSGRVLVLPILEVGASLEHRDYSGTLSLPANQMSDQLIALAGCIAASGLKKILTLSSHGGNSAAMMSAALEIRAHFNLLNVVASWSRFGTPPGLVDREEAAMGIHGGFVETSLMLHWRSDLVRQDQSENWSSNQAHLAATYDLLRAYGPIGFGWMSQDLNTNGVVGNSAAATAEAGAAIASYQADALITLVTDMIRAPFSDLISNPDPS